MLLSLLHHCCQHSRASSSSSSRNDALFYSSCSSAAPCVVSVTHRAPVFLTSSAALICRVHSRPGAVPTSMTLCETTAHCARSITFSSSSLRSCEMLLVSTVRWSTNACSLAWITVLSLRSLARNYKLVSKCASIASTSHCNEISSHHKQPTKPTCSYNTANHSATLSSSPPSRARCILTRSATPSLRALIRSVVLHERRQGGARPGRG